MLASGLFTEMQYDNGRKELVQCICCFLEGLTAQMEVSIIGTDAHHLSNESNEWSSEESDDETHVSPTMALPLKEFGVFEKYITTRFQPTMEKTKSLGAYDDDNNPREIPVLAFEQVIKKEDDLPSGKNSKGKYDLVKYFWDHKDTFPGLSKVFIGTLAPHITTEVDCESLFSQAEHASHHPNCNRTVAETFVVMGKHRLSRIFAHLKR